MKNVPDEAPRRSVQQWARDYILSQDLAYKCAPPEPPSYFEEAPSEVDLRPGRPNLLAVTKEKPRTYKLSTMSSVEARAGLHHKLWHHELQAAELMCWALLRFVDTPLSFKKGLLRIAQDEIRHMALYEEHILNWGFQLGDFPIRDWLWDRVPTCIDPVEFVAFMGMGLEGANLDHTERFTSWFRTLGDERSAQIQEQIGQEEVAHVRFATHWFKEWTGGVDFSVWCEKLPPPLTPMLMRGKSLHRERRRAADFPEEFTNALSLYQASLTSTRRRGE